MRLFVALSLPEPVREALSALANGLPGARWVPPENMHLTLRFIGEVDGRDARDVDDALAAIRMPGFDLKIAGVGTSATAASCARSGPGWRATRP